MKISEPYLERRDLCHYKMDIIFGVSATSFYEVIWMHKKTHEIILRSPKKSSKWLFQRGYEYIGILYDMYP